ncbi:MAG TPA: FadR/GntR family transcriptional regulator [Streptosporangiaceae bacterium]|jgi:GntR family transcriptional repressor for pyruvate dehydrogenase complex
MGDALRPVARPRLYEQVVGALRDYVVESGLRVGGRLPPERELAERLGVSRTSIRQAIVALEVQGLVEVRHGGGTYLTRDRLEPEPLERLVDRKRRLPEILDARDAIETKLAELAARRRDDADIAEMDAALAAMRAAIDRGELCVEEDRRFHGAIIAAARSQLLADFMAHLSGEVDESRRESLRQPGRPVQSLEQHVRVADAIRDGDPERAAAAMHAHVENVGHVRLLTWTPDED